MSFSDKLASLMARPGQDPNAKDDVPWWMRYAGRGLGTVGSISTEWVDRRPYWNKALAYVVLAIPAIILCPGISSIFGSGLIFTTGVIYGMMALGRKASAEEMRSAAAADNTGVAATPQPNTNMRSNLVANAQPVSFTGTPVFDSNV
ncbi:hypothetical protein MML48_3g00021343 [Holotrichia oblita]|uniref:Uncharacterized protein n=1 Tax=Holotrichia oblita TaxID=644536 RepID=A0ACB9TH46_HOLOL|nr:hypothetical protein MML48_3g00021343 [Holotrichia oblita]